MSTSTNTKLCPFCEGEIHVECYQCLHCGAELDFAPVREEILSNPREETFMPKAPYSPNNELISDEEWNEEQKIENDSSQLATVASLACLSLGTTLLLFCICLLLFAKNGVFSLQWRASYWPLYFVFSLFSFFYGLKFLNRLEQQT